MPRVAIREFSTANSLYAGCTAEFWTVSGGAKTATHAALYKGATGTSKHANPMTLDSRGMSSGPIYIEAETICTVGGLTVASHDTGIITPGPTFRVDQTTGKLQYSFDAGSSWNDSGDYIFKHRGSWVTATAYNRNDTAIQSGNLYLCLEGHTAGVFATDLAAGKWALALSGFIPATGGTMTGDLTMGVGTKIVFEGTTDNAYEGTLDPGDPTADRTWTMPDKGGTVAMTSDILGDGMRLENLALSVTAAAGAMTVALKTSAGTDPSATDKVRVGFRSATETNGTITVAEITSALSMTLSSGSSLGCIASISTSQRFYVVLFNDGGTYRLGLYNPVAQSGAMFNHKALNEAALASATAEGGAGGADSAHTIYAPVSVTSKPFRVIGYFEALAIGGTWTTPYKVQVMQPGVPKSGSVIQSIQNFNGAMGAELGATGTTQIPSDDTIPQSTEGDEYLSTSITPTFSGNLLHVDSKIAVGASAAAYVISAIFQDSAGDALSAQHKHIGGAAITTDHHVVVPGILAGTTSATTFSVRAGPASAVTVTVNGYTGARKLGGVQYSYLNVYEIFA